jgi:hypothetical protein
MDNALQCKLKYNALLCKWTYNAWNISECIMPTI